MPPKAVLYHVCGEHLAGTFKVGYEIGPDAPIMLAPKLILRAGATVQNRPALAGPALLLQGKATKSGPVPGPKMSSPTISLLGKATALSVSQSPVVGQPKILLGGGPHIIGKEAALVPSSPEDFLLEPTTSEPDMLLEPTIGDDWLLVPTTPEEM